MKCKFLIKVLCSIIVIVNILLYLTDGIELIEISSLYPMYLIITVIALIGDIYFTITDIKKKR